MIFLVFHQQRPRTAWWAEPDLAPSYFPAQGAGPPSASPPACLPLPGSRISIPMQAFFLGLRPHAPELQLTCVCVRPRRPGPGEAAASTKGQTNKSCQSGTEQLKLKPPSGFSLLGPLSLPRVCVCVGGGGPLEGACAAPAVALTLPPESGAAGMAALAWLLSGLRWRAGYRRKLQRGARPVTQVCPRWSCG